MHARILLVDYGEVLSEAQPAETLGAMAELARMPVASFVDRYWEHRPPYDRGGSAGEFWSAMLGGEPEERTLDELVRLDVASWLEINEATLQVLEEIRSHGVPISLLSNAPRELAEALRRDPLFELFEHLIFSSELGIVKPERGIFDTASEIVSAAPGEIVFVDDRAGNVQAAADAGMQALLFSSAAQLRSALGGWLTQVP